MTNCMSCGTEDSVHPVKVIVFKGRALVMWDHSWMPVSDGKVRLTIRVTEQDLRFYPQYYGLPPKGRMSQ